MYKHWDVVYLLGWSYSREKGWTGAFLPVSDSCTTAAGAVRWAGDHQDKQVIHDTDVWDRRMLTFSYCTTNDSFRMYVCIRTLQLA